MIAYQLRVYSGTTPKGVITDMVWQEYTRRVNNFGMLRFLLPEGHKYAAEIQKNRRIEVWRKPEAGSWYKEETYIIRGTQYAWNGAANDLLVTGVTGNWLLSTRIVAWKSGTANRSTFDSQKAETVAKNLVKYNLGSDATTANGRIVAGNLSSVTVQADAAGGNAIDWSCAFENLLSTLQGVAEIGGGDFGMYWTGSAWDFRWYTGQIGTDRSASLVFSLARDNLDSPSLTNDWLQEKTLAIIGGQGEGDDRNVRTKQGADWSAENQIEVFVDARDVNVGEANENDLLDKRGEATLSAAKARSLLEFKIKQSQFARYGTDYTVGDLGTVVYGNANATVQIAEVKVTFAAGRDEVISIGVKNV
jgi:hypothetical protein